MDSHTHPGPTRLVGQTISYVRQVELNMDATVPPRSQDPGSRHQSGSTPLPPVASRQPSLRVVATVSLLFFIIGFAYVLVRGIWVHRTRSTFFCSRNLRNIFVAGRRLPPRHRARPCFISAAHLMLRQSYPITPRESAYIYPESPRIDYTVYHGPETGALLCPLDPDYARKRGPALAGSPDIMSSYTWCPDSRTLAYCPYHGLVLRPDGRIEDGRLR